MYSKNDKNYWLFVESEFNRKQDEINGYKNLGISESKLKKLRFSKGDIIFTYISNSYNYPKYFCVPKLVYFSSILIHYLLF